MQDNDQIQFNPFLQVMNQQILDTVRAHGHGQLREMVLTHFNCSGKQLRPKMISALGQLLKVQEEHLVCWAACCEILHNATLIHDDLQDGDLYRRGEPTIWSRYGQSEAINVGDFLLLLAPRPILESSLDDDVVRELLNLYSLMSAQIVNGQNLEFELNQLSDLDSLESTYLSCIAQKTSALFAGVATGVAYLARLGAEEREQVRQLFEKIGHVFQIQDDILDLWGDKQRHEMGCDIKEGKVSFLIVKHLLRHPVDRSLFRSVLLKPRDQTSIDEVESLKALMFERGTLDEALIAMNSMILNLQQSPVLDRAEGLAAYVRDLLTDILRPIEHLSLQPKEASQERVTL